VNPGGEPERDETGLPPVDIEIPDDARELDRDVQAYYREQRAARRQQRGLRVRGSLAKDGIVLPLLACCLILALITGTLLTVFSATSDQNLARLPGSGQTARPATSGAASGPSTPKSGSAASGGAASGGAASGSAASDGASSAAPTGVASVPDSLPGVLPQATLVLNGKAPFPVQDLNRTMLVLIPARCNCGATVSWLISIAWGAHARTFLIYTASTEANVVRLSQRLDSGIRAQASLALDVDNRLRSGIPGSQPSHGLAAILVGVTQDSVHYATGLSPRDDPTTLIKSLTH
jgi:hypothetical protein